VATYKETLFCIPIVAIYFWIWEVGVYYKLRECACDISQKLRRDQFNFSMQFNHTSFYKNKIKLSLVYCRKEKQILLPNKLKILLNHMSVKKDKYANLLKLGEDWLLSFCTNLIHNWFLLFKQLSLEFPALSNTDISNQYTLV